MQDFHRIDYWKSDGFKRLVDAIEHEPPIEPHRKNIKKWRNLFTLLLLVSSGIYLTNKVTPSPPLTPSPSASPSLSFDACNNTPSFISCGEKPDFANYNNQEGVPLNREKEQGRLENFLRNSSRDDSANNSDLNFWPNILNWHMAMSYDATQMLIEAISRQLAQQKTPTRNGTQEALANPDFKTEGLTGIITLQGSDRKEKFRALIRPDCSNKPCSWREIKMYSKGK